MAIVLGGNFLLNCKGKIIRGELTMAGLEVTGVQKGQSTTGTTGGQPKQKRNIVIEFSSLPENMRTEKVRLFYDKDDSGFLESNNANGQNEVALMQQAFGLDLSKYTSNIRTMKSYKITDTGNYTCETDDSGREINKKYPKKTITTGYDAAGKKVVRLGFFKKEDLKKADMSGNLTIEECHYQSGKPYETTNYSKDFKPYTKLEQKNGKFKAYYFLKNGYWMCEGKTRHFSENMYNTSWIENKSGFYDNRGNLIQELEDGRLYKKDEITTLSKGKNTLQKHNIRSLELNTIESSSAFDKTVEDVLKKAKQTNQETKYTLNGKQVQAKPIGKGRYEITDENGNISYISHDGVKLNAEYVRKNR